MTMSDAELIRNYIVAARNWVENGTADGPGASKQSGNIASQSAFSHTDAAR
jgi:hypothetical protein